MEIENIQNSAIWILDSGCTKNMTGNLGIIHDIQPYPRDLGVRIVDGTLAQIKGIGRVKVTPSITLFTVIYVPKLSCNLLFVSQLTRYMNWEVIIGARSCEFQDLSLGKMIDKADFMDGLYRLQGGPTSYKSALSSGV